MVELGDVLGRPIAALCLHGIRIVEALVACLRAPYHAPQVRTDLIGTAFGAIVASFAFLERLSPILHTLPLADALTTAAASNGGCAGDASLNSGLPGGAPGRACDVGATAFSREAV